MRVKRENTKPTFIRRVLACLVSAAMAVAFIPAAAFADDPPLGDITVTETHEVHPGDLIYLSYMY